MATRLKPTRINVDNNPRVGDGAAYQNDNDFHWSMGGGDMSYRDFEWVTLTGNSLVIENISNNVTPTGDFTVSAGTLKPGIEYVLRVNTGNTPYTMTLGTGVTNPNGYDTELTPNKVNQFTFIATSDSQLELEGVDTSDFVTLGTQQTITAKKTFNVEPELGTAKTTNATNNGTKLATEAQVYKKIDKVQSPTADHLASLTSGGGVADSGIAKSTVELNTNKETGDAPTDTTSKYPSSHTVKKYVDDQVAAATAGAVSDAAYDATTWDGVTGIAPSKNAVRDKIVTMDSAISGNTSDISTINGKIPSEASTSNQLADKAYVGDSINSVTAFYITKNAAGDQFATYAELAAATTFYSGGQVRVPTKNDYTIVLDDENHDHATTRYIYNNVWEYQYTVNETALTQAQLDALNSGITSGKVSTYDGYATNKQDKLVNQTNIKSINNNSLLGSGNLNIREVPTGGSNNDVLTWIMGTPAWTGPKVTISSQNNNVFDGQIKIRGGTKTDHEALTPENNTLYFVFKDPNREPGQNTLVYYNINDNDTNTNIYDLSGNNHTQTRSGTPTYSTDATYGRVATFDGSSFTQAANIINFGNEFTMIALVKLETTTHAQTIIAECTSTSLYPVGISAGYSGASYEGRASGTSAGQRVDSITTPTYGTWSMVAFTRTATSSTKGTLKIYVNGQLDNTVTDMDNPSYSSGNALQIGRRRSGTSQYTNYMKGDFKLFIGENRTWNDSEIAAIAAQYGFSQS